MTETKPTAGALRAAKAIDEFCITQDLNDISAISGIAEIIDRETNLPQLEADSKKLREPAVCNAGHKSNLPVALWDCPVCTQLLRDKLQKVEELVKASRGVAQLWPHLAHYLRGEQAQIEARRSVRRFEHAILQVEAALKGSAQ